MINLNIDFVRIRKKCYIISAALVAITLILTIWLGPVLDITFKGGTLINYSYEGEVDLDAIQATAEEALGVSVRVQQTADALGDKQSLQISTAGTESISIDVLAKLTDKLQEQFNTSNMQFEENISVDAPMGREFLLKCLYAVAVAAVMIIIYVAIRFSKIGGWSAGLIGVGALIHDLMVVYLTFIIFRIPMDGNFIAVLLTILGYSINDTIVIYDRIRENEKAYGRKLTFPETVNKSINQSFFRTINTALSTLIALITMCVFALIFNVDTIVNFAFPMVIGMFSGFYSTVFLTGPVWTDLVAARKRRLARKPKKGATKGKRKKK